MHPTVTGLPAGEHFGELDAVAVAGFQQSAMAENTGVAYRFDWRQFTRWARLRELTALPASPETVAAYLVSRARLTNQTGEWLYAPSTLGRRLAAIAKAHQLAGLASPCRDPQVSTTLAGIRRQRVRPTRRAAPLLLADLRRVLQNIELRQFPQAVIGRRDAALLLMGFAGAFRRFELTALTVADVALHPQDGLHVRMRPSKTDQQGRGSVKALPYGTNPDTCPPCTYLRWRQVLDAADADGRVGILRTLRQRPGDGTPTGHLCRIVGLLTDGDSLPKDRPLFRAVHKTGVPGFDSISGHVVGAVVKRRAAAAGLNAEHLSGHSLRTGFVTQAVRGGADAGAIMRQTGHRSSAMVELYRRANAPLLGNAVTALGL